MVHFKQLNNGIRLVVKSMPGLMSVTMGILVHTGACNENDKTDGISHFIEHMMFKGTPKRTAFQISDEMDRIGAQVNAFTSKDMTCYYAKSITSHAQEAFGVLADLFLNSNFPEEEMVREKGVIIEEINMYEDTPDDLCLDALSSAFFGKDGYGRNILGTPKNVQSFTKEDVKAYMDSRYTTDNIVISMAGNIDINLAEELVERYFGSLAKTTSSKRIIEVNYNHQSAIRNKDIEQIHIGLAYPTIKRYDELEDATQIMNIILGGGMSSRLFQEVREKLGLAYTVYSYLTKYEEVGSLVIYAGVNSQNYLKSVEAIYACISDIKNKNITEDEFLRGKEQVLSSLIFGQESTSSQMLLYGKEMLYANKIFDFEAKTKLIEGVTLDNVLSSIDLNFDSSRMAIAVVGNVKQGLPLL